MRAIERMSGRVAGRLTAMIVLAVALGITSCMYEESPEEFYVVPEASTETCGGLCQLLDDCGELVHWTYEECVEDCETRECPVLRADFWISCIEEYCEEDATYHCSPHLPDCL